MERIDRIEAGILALQEAQARNEAQQAKLSAELNAQLAKSSAEWNARQAKIDAQFAKTDAQIARNEELQAKSSIELEAKLAKTDTQLAKTDAKLKEIGIQLGNIGCNLGVVAEEFFYYTLKDKMKFGNIKFDRIYLNMFGSKKGLDDEFDIVMYNGKSIAIIEIKHKVHPNDLLKLKTNKIANFKSLFPDYADYKVYLGIGGFSVPQDIEDLAKEDGIAVLRQKGEIAEILDKNLVAY